jgi:endonuclease-3
MLLQERFNGIIAWFQKNRPIADSELNYNNPYELIVAVILSAQCTDKRVNMVTPSIFEVYPDFISLAQANVSDVFELIRSISYPNNKSKHLVNMAIQVMNEFGGTLPHTVTQLQTLPGVGRKTANVVASIAFDVPAIAVDTHVFRTAARLGLTSRAKNPLQAEKILSRHIPRKLHAIAHHWLILHGRYVCVSRKPKCYECGLKIWCAYYAKLEKG